MEHDFKITVFGPPLQVHYACKNCLTEFYMKGGKTLVTATVLQDLDIPVECDRFLMEVNYENYN